MDSENPIADAMQQHITQNEPRDELSGTRKNALGNREAPLSLKEREPTASARHAHQNEKCTIKNKPFNKANHKYELLNSPPSVAPPYSFLHSRCESPTGTRYPEHSRVVVHGFVCGTDFLDVVFQTVQPVLLRAPLAFPQFSRQSCVRPSRKVARPVCR